MHRFEASEDGNEMLLLVYPPRAILELAETLLAAERLHGPLPADHTPLTGDGMGILTKFTRPCS